MNIGMRKEGGRGIRRGGRRLGKRRRV